MSEPILPGAAPPPVTPAVLRRRANELDGQGGGDAAARLRADANTLERQGDAYQPSELDRMSAFAVQQALEAGGDESLPELSAGGPAPSYLSPNGKARYEALSFADRASYEQARAAASARGRQDLDALLEAGKLTLTDARGQTLAADLGQLAASRPASASTTAAELVDQVASQLATPGVINQGPKNTCGATTVQYALAVSDPAEYARLAMGLATGDGQVALRTPGKTIARVPDSLDNTEGLDPAGNPRDSRNDVSRLMQAAFMDYGHDARGAYHNTTDQYQRGFGLPGLDRGLPEGKVADLYADVFGTRVDEVGTLPIAGATGPAFFGESGDIERVLAEVRQGHAVPVDVFIAGLPNPAPAGPSDAPYTGPRGPIARQETHQVLVLGYTPGSQPGEGTVEYRNPWGFKASMTEAEFRSRMTDGFVPRTPLLQSQFQAPGT